MSMRSLVLPLLLAASLHGQVYSPRVLLKGQPDASKPGASDPGYLCPVGSPHAA